MELPPDYKRLKEREKIIQKGINDGRIGPYTKEMFDTLKKYNYGGLPASFTLFLPELCEGRCYDRAVLMSLAFEECKVVSAMMPCENFHGMNVSGHAFVETEDKVADTTRGLLFDKELYYEIEQPQVMETFSKQQCNLVLKAEGVIGGNDEKQKHWSTLSLPAIESVVKNSENPMVKVLYRPWLEELIAEHKANINYDKLCDEQIDIKKIGKGSSFCRHNESIRVKLSKVKEVNNETT